MKTVIYTFSGTGNTMHAARKTAAALKAELKFFIKESKENNFTCTAERILFFFPVYYWGPPALVRKFIEKLQMPNAAYISVLANAASSYGASFSVIDSVLNKKAKSLAHGFGVFMPTNYIPFFNVKDADKETKKLRTADKRIEKYIKEVEALKVNGPFKASFIAEKFHGLTHDRNAAKDKKFFLSEGCIKCAVCAKVCPVDNIKMVKGAPQWLGKCVQCLGCINYCPARVIQIKRAFSKKQGRYRHPEITAEIIAGQK